MIPLMYYGTYIVRPTVMLHPVEDNLGYCILPNDRVTTCFVVYVKC